MSIRVYGTDHNYSSIDEREKIHDAVGVAASREAAFFITCNRVEGYGYNINPQFDYCYDHRGAREVHKHLVALACGLKSQLLGERQILEQLSEFSYSIDKSIGDVILDALREASELRDRFSLNAEHTVADAVYQNARRRGVLGKKTIIIGTGKVASMVADRFHKDSPLCFISRKHKDRARALAAQYGGEARSREELRRMFDTESVIISAAGSPHYVLKPGDGAEKNIVYDLSVPRTIDPSLGAIDLEGLSAEFNEFNNRVRDRVASAEREILRRYGS